MECFNAIGDVCLIGSTVDTSSFGHNLHKLIGSRGVIQGKLTVCFTTKDNVLSYMFKSARFGESPIGLAKLKEDYLMTCLRENDPKLASLSEPQLKRYFGMKFENINVTCQVDGHLDYKKKLSKIIPSVDFNGDLQYFKERSV